MTALSKPPPWLELETQRVVPKFVAALTRRVGWQVLYIISPWISPFDAGSGISFTRLLDRLQFEDVTTYVVTRPPLDAVHAQAVSLLERTGVANIAFLENLHSKIYMARTDSGCLGMLGSANFTAQSLRNLEIGIVVTDYGDGAQVVRSLLSVAQDVYRAPGRRVVCQRRFGRPQ